jgi:hypothetical protein
MKIVNLFLIGLVLIGFSGCAARYHQPSAELQIGKTMEFLSTGSITLVNGQPSTEEVLFYKRGYANLNAWTNVACAIIERELSKHNVKVMKDAPKTITLSVESAKTEIGMYVARSRLSMSAKTSDGYSATYVGNDASGGGFSNPPGQMDRALARAIGELLNDPRMIRFLTN